MDLPSAADNTIGTTVQSSTTEQDELSQRLARLRQVWLNHVIRRKKIINKTCIEIYICTIPKDNGGIS